jgi:uncharacterized protein (DUF486 family)
VFVFGYSVLGLDILSDALPAKQQYTKETFYGESVIDSIEIKDINLSESDIFSIDSEVTEFNVNTILLANFENTLEAGNLVSGFSMPAVGYRVRRKIEGDLLNPTIALINDVNMTSYVDCTVANNQSYIYTVVSIFDDNVNRREGLGLESEAINVSFWGWMLSSLDGNTNYNFFIGNESGEINSNKDIKIFENYTKYPAFRIGVREYRNSEFKTMPVTVDSNNNIIFTETYLKGLVSFLNNGQEKILRSPSNDVIKVVTSNAKYKYLDEITTPENTQPIEIKFDWFESGAV